MGTNNTPIYTVNFLFGFTSELSLSYLLRIYFGIIIILSALRVPFDESGCYFHTNEIYPHEVEISTSLFEITTKNKMM